MLLAILAEETFEVHFNYFTTLTANDDRSSWEAVDSITAIEDTIEAQF